MNRLHFNSFATERDLRQAILETGRLCYESGLMLSNNGNISARLGDDKFALPSSEDNAQAIRELIQTHNAVLIRNHGAIIRLAKTWTKP